MKLPGLISHSTSTASHSGWGMRPGTAPSGIVPALCFPGMPLEMDFQIFSNMSPADLSRTAQTSTGCRDAVYGYVEMLWNNGTLLNTGCPAAALGNGAAMLNCWVAGNMDTL